MSDVARALSGTRDRKGSVDIVLEAVPHSIATARHAVADLLERNGVVPEEVVEDVLLLVSELVTNVVLHAKTAVRVMARVDAVRVMVAVGDQDPHHPPVSAERGLAAPSGRGLRLVDLLASSWGVEVGTASKVVWFELSFQPALVNLRS